MSTVWTTQKGDEWRYKRNGVEASADFDSNESLLSIRHVRSKKCKLSQSQLLKLLRDTKECFASTDIKLNVSSSETELNSMANLLSNNGLLKIQGKKQQGSTSYKIIGVAKKKWWELW